MTQTATPPAAPAGPGASGDPGGGAAPDTTRGARRVAAVRAAVGRYFAGSPGELRRLALVAVVAALVAAAGGALALRERSAALDEAQASASQLVLLQGTRTDLVQAHADATNSFLRGGLEDPAQRADYERGVAEASGDLPGAAAGADDGQVGTLTGVSQAVSRYAGAIEAARANNRQGFPVGAAYLANARTTLDTEIVPALTRVADAEAEDVTSAYSRSGRAGWLFAVIALLGLAALVWAQLRLARRSRRILNVPAAAATAVLAVVLLGAGILMAVAQTQANDVRSGALADATALGNARVQAFTARAAEGAGLVNRGSGAAQEEPWRQALDGARRSAAGAGVPAAGPALEAYAERHAALRELDAAGDWNGAVAIATGTVAEAESAVVPFERFDDATAEALAAQDGATRSGLDEAGGGLGVAAWLVLAAGVAAAVGAWAGFAQRLDEYR